MLDIANPPPRLDTLQASDYLFRKHGITRTPATLATKRSRGGGPKFQLVGKKPKYTPASLDEHALELLGKPVRSTSEYESAHAA